MMPEEKQPITYKELLSKLMRYCSYQERSEWEVICKAKDLGGQSNDLDRLIEDLQKENFINEARFAEAYVRGKVRIKKWGILKIKEGLKQKRLDAKTISAALNTIDQDLYRNNLKELLVKKGYTKKLDSKERAKVYRYLQSKGYQGEIIVSVLN